MVTENPQDPSGLNVSQPQKTLMERKEILARQIQMAVAQGGRVESQSDANAVIVKGKQVNHLLHFLIGVFTCGLWWIAWLIIAITGGEKREMVVVDDWGNASVQHV